MLATLRVKNLALVEDAQVTFGPGLNVITGETGAGKSVLISALNLLTGERADRTLIRSGADSCTAEAVFHLRDSGTVDDALEKYGLAPCDDGTLIIRRVFRASGVSQHFVNDTPVTLAVLKDLGDLLVDMHGPYDHQSLLRPAYQLDLLDAFAHLWAMRAEYESVYRRWAALQAERARLVAPGSDPAERIDLLTWRIKEIEEIHPQAGEEEALQEEHTLIGNAHQILQTAGAALSALCDGEGSAFDALTVAQKQLDELSRLVPDAAMWNQEAREAAARLQALADEIRHRVAKIEADPARLEWLDKRLAEYQRLKKKYGGSVEVALKLLAESKAELEALQTRDERLKELDAKIAQARAMVLRKGEQLSASRRGAARDLEKAVTRELKELGFEHGYFAVGLRTVEPTSSGLDETEFGFAPNLGEPVRPLRAIASSGEISRVMLAIKVVLAAHDRIPVMVFDEIDANVGGEIGNAVGRKLAQVGRNHQVVCITHLPQVAVFGRQQLVVRKRVRDERTYTEVESLNEDGRVEEIARMLGGKDLTSVALRHAREMLVSARSHAVLRR